MENIHLEEENIETLRERIAKTQASISVMRANIKATEERIALLEARDPQNMPSNE